MSDKKFLYLTVVVVLALWVGISFGILKLVPGWPERGQFGDLFGAVNSLFSGLGFAGLLYTIVIQQKQIGMQREELAMQRQELGLQREEMKASRGELANQTLAQQALFKATVAQLTVAAHQARIDSIKLQFGDTNPSIRQGLRNPIEDAAKSLDQLASELLSEFEIKDPVAVR